MRTRGLIIIIALWLFAAGAGSWVLMNYENTPTLSGNAPALWPAGSHIPRETDHYTLLMFVHPHCPCSRASIGELNRLMAQCPGLVSTHVLFVRPKGMSEDWANTALRENAVSIPHVQVTTDAEGEEARRFGAESSGSVVLYDPHGKLLFNGGITSSRGHVGENAGETSIIEQAHGRDVSLKHTEVYGCALLDHCELTTNASTL